MKLQSFLFASLLFINFSLKAVEGNKTGNTRPQSFITGEVIDAETQQPIEYASVSIYKFSDSTLVTGGITDVNGKFNITDVPFGKYIVKYKYIGYNEGRVNEAQLTTTTGLNLGTLRASIARQQIGEVVVTGQKSLYESKIDRKVFNADQVITGKSGNASDLLKQVPSVDVDIDGAVSLRGSSNVTILINGKPAATSDITSYLQQMQANTIDKIEVITNPSSKYDPDGTAGILNIVLKKGATQGFNGSINFNTSPVSSYAKGIDFTNWNKYNGGINLNYNPGKYNVYIGYNYRNEPRWNRGDDKRTTLFNNDTLLKTTTSNELGNRISHNFKTGIDLYLGSSNTLGFSGGFSNRLRDNKSSIIYNIQKAIVPNYYRNGISKEDESGIDAMTYFMHNFDKPNHTLRIDLNYANETRTGIINNKQDGIPTNIIKLGQDRTITDHKHNMLAAQTDYSLPISEGMSLEAGAKSQTRIEIINLQADTLELNANWINRPNITNNFKYYEQINAGYITFLQTLGNFSYQAGLRLEYSIIKPELLTGNKKFENNHLELFPSLHMTQKLNEKNELAISYSRRVNRPNEHMLNPFPDYSDPTSLRVGNPMLNPEFINSVELGYTWKKERNTIQPTIFYRYTQNGFTRVQKQISPTSMIVSFENLNSNQSYGADLNINWQILKFWNVNFSGSGYQYFIDANNLKAGNNKQGFGYNAKLMSNTMLSKGLGIQFGVFYRSPFVTPQGESSPMIGTNAGIKKEVLKGKGTLSLNANDIFDTQRMQMKSAGDSFFGNMTRKRESRVIYIGFIYRFGVAPKNGKKDKQRESDNNGSGDDNMY